MFRYHYASLQLMIYVTNQFELESNKWLKPKSLVWFLISKLIFKSADISKQIINTTFELYLTTY
jgi:hypothetical protein